MSNYPTITMQKSGGTEYTFPAPAPGSDINVVRQQAIGNTAGGDLVIYDKGAEYYEITITLNMLSATEKVNLQTHFTAVAGGSFTYVNSSGNSYTAYFLTASLPFTQVATGFYGVILPLRLSSAGV